MTNLNGFLSLIAFIFCTALLFVRAAHPDPGDETRVAQVKDLMRGVQQPAMKRLMAAAKQTPATDKDWDEIRSAAALLNEDGHILMQAGRSKDELWSKACSDLRAATAAICSAAEAKDLKAVKVQIPKVGVTCKTCHAAHKK